MSKSLVDVIREARDALRAEFVPADQQRNPYSLAEVVEHAVAHHRWHHDPGGDGVRVARTSEVEKLQAQVAELKKNADACRWDADHQRAALVHVGGEALADEFPWGCDAIDHVAEALLAARKKRDELQAQIDGLLDLRLKYMGESPDGKGFDISIATAQFMTAHMAESLWKMLEGSPNYTEATLTLGKEGKGVAVLTVTRLGGKTPHQMRAEAEQQRDDARHEADDLLAQLKLRGSYIRSIAFKVQPTKWKVEVLTSNAKHGPKEIGGPGDCDPDCLKCWAERTIKE